MAWKLIDIVTLMSKEGSHDFGQHDSDIKIKYCIKKIPQSFATRLCAYNLFRYYVNINWYIGPLVNIRYINFYKQFYTFYLYDSLKRHNCNFDVTSIVLILGGLMRLNFKMMYLL